MNSKINVILYLVCTIILNPYDIKASSSNINEDTSINANLKFSNAGTIVLQQLQGFRQDAYKEGEHNLLIGYGHLVNKQGDKELATLGIDPKTISEGTVLPKEELEALFALDIIERANIKPFVHQALSQNQFDALTSFCYNIGYGNLSKSNTVRDLNAGKIIEAADHMVTWGSKIPGLVKRHFVEVSIYIDKELNPNQDISSQVGIHMPSCDAAWANLRANLKQRVVELYQLYKKNL